MMRNYLLFDDERWEQLLPLTFTKPTAQLLIGIDTIEAKWNAALSNVCSYLTRKYLAEKYIAQFSDDNIYVNGGIVPDESLVSEIIALEPQTVLICNGELIAARSTEHYFSRKSLFEHIKTYQHKEYSSEYISISRPWHLFQYNETILNRDFQRICAGRASQTLSSTNKVFGDRIFIEEGAKVECSIINSLTGPVYIGKNVEIMEGCMIRGPLSIGENSTLKMGARIYGAVSIGKNCKCGGEISQSVVQSNSNKAHEGFLGNSVIGEWCNLGADTNTSNLKNNYAEVKLWDHASQRFIQTGLQFCGLIMGDHSKSGINTMFNTGTVVGVSANIFGDGFPRNFIPSFSWGGAAGFTTYKIRDALETAGKVMKRRNIEIDQIEKNILSNIYAISEKYRKGELIFLKK